MSLRCYAWGAKDDWEGMCIDLDLAVQGRSLDEVKSLLNEAVGSYLDDLQKEAAPDARRLLHRRAPLWLRLRLQFEYAIARMLDRTRDGNHRRHGYAFHCPA